jgi:tetratricopeptide (TPR) repeat protein
MSDTVTIRAADGTEYAYALDRVLDGLVSALSAGHVDAAVSLYAQIREDIAFQLINKTQAHPEIFRQVANLFFQARDFSRAGYCCEHLDEPAKAAELYERGDDFSAAAQMYAAAGHTKKAAEMFEKAGSLVEAAKLFLLLGADDGDDNVVRAAMCFEKAGRIYDAAVAWMKAERLEKALGLFLSIDEDSPEKKHADAHAKDLQQRLSLKRANTGQMLAVGPAAVDIGGGVVLDAHSPSVTMMEGFEALRRVPLFGQLSLAELKTIYHLCQVTDVAFGEKLVEAGKPSPALWIVLNAIVDVRGAGGRDVARLQAGDHLGEMGLFDDAVSGVEVVVAAPGRALRLNKVGFRDAMAANDAFATRIYRVLFSTMRDRLRETTDLLLAERHTS